MSAYAVGRKYILQLQIAQRKHLTFVIVAETAIESVNVFGKYRNRRCTKCGTKTNA